MAPTATTSLTPGVVKNSMTSQERRSKNSTKSNCRVAVMTSTTAADKASSTICPQETTATVWSRRLPHRGQPTPRPSIKPIRRLSSQLSSSHKQTRPPNWTITSETYSRPCTLRQSSRIGWLPVKFKLTNEQKAPSCQAPKSKIPGVSTQSDNAKQLK